MAISIQDTDLNFGSLSAIIGALVNPVSADPGAPANSEVWYNTTAGRLKVKTAGGIQQLAFTTDVTGGSITGALWDPQTVVISIVDDTPFAQVIGQNEFLGRLTGNIGAVTAAQVKTLLEGLGINATTLATLTPANLRDRTTHTGVQALSTISPIATARIVGRTTAGLGAAEELTATQTKTILAISNTDVSGLGALATLSSVSLTTQATGTLQAAQEPAHTGDVTNTAGSLVLTIANSAVTNAKLANVVTGTFKGRTTAATGVVEDLTATQATALLDVVGASKGLMSSADKTKIDTIASGATANSTDASLRDRTTHTGVQALSTISPITTARILGRVTAAAGIAEELTAAQTKTLLAIASGDVSGLGALATQSSVNLTTQATGTLQAPQAPARTGDVTGTAGTATLTIANAVVTNAKLANVATATFKGRVTAATGAPEDMTVTQATSLLNIATTALKGLMSSADKTKLDGVATGATVNATDASLRDRTTHTGVQTAATISDFNTAADTRAQLKIDALVNGASAALDTLAELAAALGNDANFAATVNTALALRTQKFSANIGNASLQTFVVNHALGTADVIVQVRRNSDNAVINATVELTDANNVTVKTNSVPALNAYRVVVVG